MVGSGRGAELLPDAQARAGPDWLIRACVIREWLTRDCLTCAAGQGGGMFAGLLGEELARLAYARVSFTRLSYTRLSYT